MRTGYRPPGHWAARTVAVLPPIVPRIFGGRVNHLVHGGSDTEKLRGEKPHLFQKDTALGAIG